MNKVRIFNALSKSISMSVAIVIFGMILTLMLSFFFAFVQEASFDLPFGIANIVTVHEGEGHSTLLQLGSGLFATAATGFIILSVILFLFFLKVHKNKKL